MINRGRRTKAQSVVAPVGGLNDADSIADMPPTDAITLDNWFPGTQSVDVRGGSVEWATGMSTTGETLMTYSGVYSTSQVKRIFAAAGGNIYDVTNTGAITTAVVSGKTNARWDYVNFANAAGSYLVAVNGADLPIFYNGNAWTASGTGYATAITGVTASLFTQVSVWKNRLFFVEKNSLSCWYLVANAIGGAAAELDFGPVAKLGGTLIATSTITTSAGLTLDDYFVAITSEGECLVYRGTDPSDPAKFALVGNYRIGRPIANGTDNQGGRWLTKFGADIVAITADGFTTLQGMLNADVVAQRKTINDKIINSVTSAVTSYKSNFGWQALLCPIQNKLIINVPTATPSGTLSGQSLQFVMNTITGAWCRFTDWNATCFAYFNDEIYAIIGDAVYKVDVPGANDLMSNTSSGSPVFADAKTAFIYFGGRGEQKQFQMARALIASSGDIAPLMNINTNLSDEVIEGTLDLSSADDGGTWDYSTWQPDTATATWAYDTVLHQDWTNVNGIGYSASLKIQLYLSTNRCKWNGWEIMYSKGGLL